jgi:hypothetical protein
MTSRVFPSIVPAVLLMVFVILFALAQRSSATPAAVKASSAARSVVPRTPWGDPATSRASTRIAMNTARRSNVPGPGRPEDH